MKRLLFSFAFLAALGLSFSAQAAGAVWLCDPVNLGYCAYVDSTGHVLFTGTATVSGNVTVVQPTGTNLHIVLDSGTVTTVTTLTNPAGIKGADGSTIASTANPVPIEGGAASGATISGSPLGNGCRAATTAPTPVTDGQAVFYLCGAEGKSVVLPYAIKELAVRGSTSGTDNAAHTIIASAGGSLKNYITGLQCSNTSSTTTTVTMSDSASSVFIVPALGGTNLTFPIPLATAAATAFTFTAATGVTTMTCNAQGYTGL